MHHINYRHHNKIYLAKTEQVQWYTLCGKKVSPKVVCQFLSNRLKFLCEILHVYYLFIYT